MSVPTGREQASIAGPGKVSFGSKPDERGHRPGGPHLGVKQTKSGAKQTLPLEGLLSARERTFSRQA